MIQLIPYAPSEKFDDELKYLYITSFPLEERRDWDQLLELVNLPYFNFYKIFNNNVLAGMITIWQWSDFTFIEHFAITEFLRGKGIGKEVITLIIKEMTTSIVLEVEEPMNDSAKRRIDFYKRLGFFDCQETYYQPPYHIDKKPVKMMLMSYPGAISQSNFLNIRAKLYREVYHWNITDFT